MSSEASTSKGGGWAPGPVWGGEGGKEREKEEEDRVFACSLCGLEERYDYFGRSPKWTSPIQWTEDLYVLRDPFAPPDKSLSTQFLLLGGHCALCKAAVCVEGSSCSLYYAKRLCLHCLRKNFDDLPQQLRDEVRRMKLPHEEAAAKDKANE